MMTTLPAWLHSEPAAVYFPSPKPGMAEAWPVTARKPAELSILVTTERGELRFRNHDLSPIGFYTRTYAPVLLPASDERVLAAKERTDVLRAVHQLNAVWRDHRPGSGKSTAEIIADLSVLLDAVSVACDDVTDLIATRFGR